jgi:hypothetical protein
VVAGTAGAVHHHQNKKWAKHDAEHQAQYNQAYQQGVYDAQQSGPPPQQYAAPAPDDLTAKLQRLADLHQSGVLTDAEFAAAKEQLLAGR